MKGVWLEEMGIGCLIIEIVEMELVLAGMYWESDDHNENAGSVISELVKWKGEGIDL